MSEEKDYCTNKQNAQSLVLRLKQYYYDKGYTNFDVWMEPRAIYSPSGDNIAIFYDIRSNLKFKVPA